MNRTAVVPALCLLAAVAGGCGPPSLQVMPDCDYAARPAGREHLFVLPTFEEYVSGTGETVYYAAPERSARLRLSSFAYSRHLAGRRVRLIGEVEGRDGRYEQWLLEDCRLLYAPAGPGVEGKP